MFQIWPKLSMKNLSMNYYALMEKLGAMWYDDFAVINHLPKQLSKLKYAEFIIQIDFHRRR